VQAIDILRDQVSDVTALFHCCQRTVRSAGCGQFETWPPDQRTYPVALANERRTAEILELKRPGLLPLATLVAVIGYAGGGADAGAGQYQQARVTGDEIAQQAELLVDIHASQSGYVEADRRITMNTARMMKPKG
jgi:hypothetical protein